MADEVKKTEAILAVEDSKPNRLALVTMLKQYGYPVLEAEDGEQALGILEEPGEYKIVAVFSDLMMPKMDGLELLTMVRMLGDYHTLPFVFISAVCDGDQVMRAMEMNIKDYLMKPVTVDKVREKMFQIFPHLETSAA